MLKWIPPTLSPVLEGCNLPPAVLGCLPLLHLRGPWPIGLLPLAQTDTVVS